MRLLRHWETKEIWCVSRHHRGGIRAPLNSQYDRVLWCTGGGFQGALNWVPIMPRGASLRVSRLGLLRNTKNKRDYSVSLGIMGDQLRALLMPFNNIECCGVRGAFMGGLNQVPIMPSDASMGQMRNTGNKRDLVCPSASWEPN